MLATVHPSSILRAPDDETRRTEMKRFTDDLRIVARALRSKR
jgi:DNA polymerase